MIFKISSLFVRAALKDLDYSKWRQLLVVLFEFFNNEFDYFIAVTLAQRKVVIDVDKVFEIVGVFIYKVFDLLVKKDLRFAR